MFPFTPFSIHVSSSFTKKPFVFLIPLLFMLFNPARVTFFHFSLHSIYLVFTYHSVHHSFPSLLPFPVHLYTCPFSPSTPELVLPGNAWLSRVINLSQVGQARSHPHKSCTQVWPPWCDLDLICDHLNILSPDFIMSFPCQATQN